MAYLVAFVSILSFAAAGIIALEMLRERDARRARIARAVRPRESRPIQWQVPERARDKVGQN